MHLPYENARRRRDVEFELVDVAAFHLPLPDEPIPPSMGQHAQPHTKRWAEKIASFDGTMPDQVIAWAGALKPLRPEAHQTPGTR